MTLHHSTLQLCYPCLLTPHLHHLHQMHQQHTLPRQNVFRNTVSLTLPYQPQKRLNCVETSNITQGRSMFSKCAFLLSTLAVPPDWFSNPDSLKESFRIASNLDWANIDLSGYPGLFCLPECCLKGHFTQNYNITCLGFYLI